MSAGSHTRSALAVGGTRRLKRGRRPSAYVPRAATPHVAVNPVAPEVARTPRIPATLWPEQ
jgi:hypothetical protein